MNPNDPGHDDEIRALEQRARIDLRRLVDDTDPAIRAQLERSATRAASLRRPPRALWMGLPIGIGVAAASVMALVLWRPAPIAPDARSPAADDLALLLNVDNLDLLEQMEFYQWLDREPALIESDASETQRS